MRNCRGFLTVVWMSGILCLVTQAEAQLLRSPSNANQVVVDATNVLSQSVAMPSGLPQSMLVGAQGVAIVPNMVRGAFVIGVQHGRGVLVTRGPGGAWQPPRMIQITGGSVGYQIGVQSTDLILIFRTPQSVANVLRGTLKVGVDASAAAGPVGRQASASTDLPLQAEILSYSRARGAFLGVSIDGSSISLDPAADASFYQPPGTMPASATQLVQLLARLASGGPQAVAPPTQQVVAVVPNAANSGPTSPPPSAPGAPASAPPSAPPSQAAIVGPAIVAPDPVNPVEAARQQLDAVSRQLAAGLDDKWREFLALPPEIYIPNHTPSQEALEQAISRYETISEDPKFSALTNQPAFQETLKGLWRLGELQQGTQEKLRLPPPPLGAKGP
jgi:lipid-binding SYLF domain-containing protein